MSACGMYWLSNVGRRGSLPIEVPGSARTKLAVDADADRFSAANSRWSSDAGHFDTDAVSIAPIASSLLIDAAFLFRAL